MSFNEPERIIQGRRFTIKGHATSKPKASKAAMEMRAKGFAVRIFPSVGDPKLLVLWGRKVTLCSQSNAEAEDEAKALKTHVVTVTNYRGRKSARCSCKLRWRNVSYDGGAGNGNVTRMIQHVRATGGLLEHETE